MSSAVQRYQAQGLEALLLLPVVSTLVIFCMQAAPHWLIHYVGSLLHIASSHKLGNPSGLSRPMLVSIEKDFQHLIVPSCSMLHSIVHCSNVMLCSIRGLDQVMISCVGRTKDATHLHLTSRQQIHVTTIFRIGCLQ